MKFTIVKQAEPDTKIQLLRQNSIPNEEIHTEPVFNIPALVSFKSEIVVQFDKLPKEMEVIQFGMILKESHFKSFVASKMVKIGPGIISVPFIKSEEAKEAKTYFDSVTLIAE